MWLLPSYGRPEVLSRLLDAPGGWPDEVCVIINDDDPKAVLYEKAHDDLRDAAMNGKFDMKVPWRIFRAPAGSRFASAVRAAYNAYPNEPFYGIIDDDYWPVTPGWHEEMVAAAGATHIAIANNKQNFPSLYTCRVMGGELARAIGTIAPGLMQHNYSDDAWGRFAEDFNLLRPLEDVIVEHHHWSFRPDVPKDATYVRGSGDFGDDKKLYSEWLNSEERMHQCERVAKLLGINLAATYLPDVKLAICTPVQDHEIDCDYRLSHFNMMTTLFRAGVDARIVETAGASHIGKARERVLWNAMHDKGFEATHLLFIDSDMSWDPDLIIRLLCADHDFSGAVGVKKQDKVAFCFNPVDPPTFHPVTGFVDTAQVGFAFILLKRSVIDTLSKAYPDLEYDTGEGPREWALFFDMLLKQPGQRLPHRMSEDYSFCQRWTAIGGKIWIDPDAELGHAGRKVYRAKPRDYMTLVPVAEEKSCV